MAFDLTLHPIIQAPMAGGATTPELVAAVSNAGGLGSLAGVMLPPERLREEIRKIRTLTDRPFNVNLFVLKPVAVAQAELEAAMERLQPIRAELGLPPGKAPAKFSENFEAQLEVLLEEKPPVVSFHFDLLPAFQVERLHQAGCKVIGTATNVAEALAWQEAGADYISAQGAEAGGHRGTFIGPFEHAMTGTLALLPQVVAAVKIPVLAAGGIMDGRGIAAALLLGASAVQMGTAFLTCPGRASTPFTKKPCCTPKATPPWLPAPFPAGLHGACATPLSSACSPTRPWCRPTPSRMPLPPKFARRRLERVGSSSCRSGRGRLPACAVACLLPCWSKRWCARPRKPCTR